MRRQPRKNTASRGRTTSIGRMFRVVSLKIGYQTKRSGIGLADKGFVLTAYRFNPASLYVGQSASME